jgi:hypothetical protein
VQTECMETRFGFHPVGKREVVAQFDGGTITSDGGAMLLAEIDRERRMVERFAACFADHRDPEQVEHSLVDLLRQRIYGLCLGYEDLLDHDQLRRDPLLATAVGKTDPVGQDRPRKRDRGCALAGKSTLQRLEGSPVAADAESRYKKIPLSIAKAEALLVDWFLESFVEPPDEIVLDFDATDTTIHGHQLGRFFHGYYDSYCYLPLYVYCGKHLLCAKLRPSNLDASSGAVKVLARLVERIRRDWRNVRIVLRGDSGFCRDDLLAWCEANRVDYVVGLAKNSRLLTVLEPFLAEAKAQFEATAQPARCFADFEYQTLDSWTRARRVIGKAEHLDKGANPRFVVTSFTAEQRAAQPLYEVDYCARGDMENRLKETQGTLFGARVSASTMRANQARLLFSAVGYALLVALRQFGTQDTELENAQCDTLRLKLLKIGAQVEVTVRKVWIHLSEAYPYRELFGQVLAKLREGLRRLPPIVGAVGPPLPA